MYYRHFGLSAPPFEFGSASDVLFMSPTHREAFAALEWGLLHETSGFTLLVGDSGNGKTTLVKRLLAQHREGLYCTYVLNPRLNLDEIMRLVLEELAGVKTP
jgi:general secretion pathway protein A